MTGRGETQIFFAPYSLSLGIVMLGSGLLYLSSADGFAKGLRSYFWDAAPATVISSDLKTSPRFCHGSVTCAVEVNDKVIEYTSPVFARSFWSREMDSHTWASAYAPGRPITIYHSSDGEMSLGHWPNSYSWGFGLSGLISLLVGANFVRLGIRRRKSQPQGPRQPPPV